MNEKATFYLARRRPAVIAPGNVFGRLTVVSETFQPGKREYHCRCTCGTVSTVRSDLLRSGRTRSCGCLRREVVSAARTTHGMSSTPTYYSWGNMIARCTNPADEHWEYYGGRGITVCDAWRSSFDAFLADMGPAPIGHTIERENVNGNYEPSNCVWATMKQQRRNTTVTRWVEIAGVRKSLAEWCELRGQSYSLARDRLNRGWDVERALSEKKHG